MRTYIDSSAFVKLVIKEEHSTALRRWVADSTSELVSSELLRTEVLRASLRHSREVATQARVVLTGTTPIPINTAICELAGDLEPADMRSLDAIHLATALTILDSIGAVLTYDRRLADACERYGLNVVAPR